MSPPPPHPGVPHTLTLQPKAAIDNPENFAKQSDEATRCLASAGLSRGLGHDLHNLDQMHDLQTCRCNPGTKDTFATLQIIVARRFAFGSVPFGLGLECVGKRASRGHG